MKFVTWLSISPKAASGRSYAIIRSERQRNEGAEQVGTDNSFDAKSFDNVLRAVVTPLTLAKMDDYSEIPDGAKMRRTFLLRDSAKSVTVLLLASALGCYFANGAGPRMKIASLVVGIVGLSIGYWAFFRPYLCPQCQHRMKVKRMPGNSAPLYLVCDHCMGCTDLKTTDSNP
jgi:hypothetical protein